MIAFVILLGIAGLLWYSRKPVLASVGVIDKGKYLEETSQDYRVIEFVNRTLGKRDSGGKVLVFLRHLYYLEARYLNGDPASGFEVDPAHLQSAREWKSFFASKHIAYVVRSPDYPRALAEPLLGLEKSGELVPFAETEVQNFQGKRIDQKSVSVLVVILRVKCSASTGDGEALESDQKAEPGAVLAVR